MSHIKSRIILFFSLLLPAVLSISVFAQSKKEIRQANEFVDQGRKAFAQKDYRGAADMFGKALAITPKNADAAF